ncbi:MAG: CbiX/SirB N-terminal domain-containing protein [Propionivibrio sp.]
MPRTALILFAHGSRDPEWALPLKRVRAAVIAEAPDLRIELAFLEFLAPSLQDCVSTMVSEGFDRIVVVPMFIAQGGHLKNDLPLIIDELRARFPNVAFEMPGPVGEAEGVVQAMAAHVLRCSAA